MTGVYLHRAVVVSALNVFAHVNQVPMRKKILVVEDEPDQLEVIRFTLKNAGYAIGTATNGIEALKKAQTAPPIQSSGTAIVNSSPAPITVKCTWVPGMSVSSSSNTR